MADRCGSHAVTVRKDVTDITSTRLGRSLSSLKPKWERKFDKLKNTDNHFHLADQCDGKYSLLQKKLMNSLIHAHAVYYFSGSHFIYYPITVKTEQMSSLGDKPRKNHEINGNVSE